MKSLVVALLFLTACTKKSAAQQTCRVTTDCQAGLFCVNAVCKTNIGSGTQCTSPSDCKSLEACVSGKCGQLGCDSTHNCNDGCCNAGQCVATDACSGDLKCGVDGVCPARCDAPSQGNGCNSGCCDTGGGACVDGTSNAACGATGACVACGSGTVCGSQACVCTGCSGNTVCSNGGCADCATNPCGGATPFCDAATTHACQPCSSAPDGFCRDATPYCNSGGACGATPDSSGACALADPNNPVLIAPAKCGCTAQTVCPNGLLCDTVAQTCRTACCADSDCASNHCDCADVACATRVCTTGCPACTFAYGNGDPKAGTCGAGNIAPVDAMTFNCDATAGACSDGPPCACDGQGACKNANGNHCAALASDPSCASGVCDYSEATGAPINDQCGGVSCGSCAFWNGADCTSEVPSGGVTADCGGTNACDGAGDCRLINDQPCSADSDCVSGACAVVNSSGAKQCSTHSCGPCVVTPSPDCVPAPHSFCPTCLIGAKLAAGMSCGAGAVCDGRGTCLAAGTCSCSCDPSTCGDFDTYSNCGGGMSADVTVGSNCAGCSGSCGCQCDPG